MTVTSFEVGSVFTIIDKATPVLERLSRQVGAFNKLIDTSKKSLLELGNTKFPGLETSLKTLGDQAASFGKKMDAALRGVQANTDATIASVDRLARSWEAVAAATRTAASAAARASVPAAGAGVIGGGGGGGRRHAPGFMSYHTQGMHVPGGHVRFGGGNAALGAAAGIGYGAYEAAELEDTIARAQFHLGKNDEVTRSKLREAVMGSLGMGFGMKDISEAVQNEVRLFKGTPAGGLDIMPEMLRSAGTEARLKGTSLNESMRSLVGMAHMTKSYSPEQIAKLAPMFSFLSTATPMSLPQIERSMSYAVPTLQSSLEMDPAEVMLAGVAMQRAGVTNTKSGTWLRELATRAMPGTSMMSKMAYHKHEAALKRLGLVDEHDKPTWFTDGKPDLQKMLGIAGERIKGIPLTERAGLERQLFGTQGSGAFSVLSDPQVRDQMTQLKKEYPAFSAQYKNFWETYKGGSPVQQARDSWGALQKVLIEIGTIALPPVVKLLQQLETALKGIQTVLPGGPKKGSPGEAMASGMGPGFAYGLGAGAIVGQPALGGAIGAVVGGKISETFSYWRQLFNDLKGGTKDGTEEGAEKGTEKGAKKGVEEGFGSLLNKMNYRGGGVGGGGVIPASFVTGGVGGGGGLHGAGGMPRALGGGAGAGGGVGPGSVIRGMSGNRSAIAAIAASNWRAAGMSENGIAGILANIGAESNFNPSTRHSDQPHWRGEANFAHGLYQEGGQEWLNYSAWLRKHHPGADWRDPALQSTFAAENLKKNYPGVWKRMQGARTREEAAAAYASGYLKPRADYLHSRIAGFNRHGVPPVDAFTGGADHSLGLHGKALRDHFGHRGRHDPSAPSSAIPPPPLPSQNEVIQIHLDGDVVARSTMRRVVRGLNSPAKGGRMPDFSSARPVSI
jgi:hypothetical protein